MNHHETAPYSPLRVAEAGVVHRMRRKQVEQPHRLPPGCRFHVLRLQSGSRVVVSAAAPGFRDALLSRSREKTVKAAVTAKPPPVFPKPHLHQRLLSCRADALCRGRASIAGRRLHGSGLAAQAR